MGQDKAGQPKKPKPAGGAETSSERERTNPESGHIETGREAREHGERLEPAPPARPGKAPKTGR